MIKGKVLGRAELTRKIRQIAPKALEKMDAAKLKVAQEAAAAIAARAPRDTGDYAASIRGGLQSDGPDYEVFGGRKTKDPTAAAVYGKFIWRFLEFGTKASAGEVSRVDRRYKSGTILTKGKRAHAATPRQPHVYPVWRGMRKKAMRRIRDALNRGVREALKSR